MGGVLSGSLALVAAAMLQSGPQDPQDPQVRPPDTVEDIVVNGVTPETIERYVESLTVGRRRGQSTDQIARWSDPLCIKTIGGRHTANLAFSQQITTAIQQFGVEAKSAGCTPNVVIVATVEPDIFARTFTAKYRNRYFQNRRSEYSPFVNQTGPVRWGHSVDWSGGRTSILDRGIAESGLGAPIVDMPNTRLRLSTAARIRRTLIVVDQTDINDVPQRALAAYVAFATLAELPRDFNAQGQDSILNLFRRDGEPVALEPTAWDVAFIQGLYGSDGFVSERVQQTAIARRMQRELTRPDPAEGEGTPR